MSGRKVLILMLIAVGLAISIWLVVLPRSGNYFVPESSGYRDAKPISQSGDSGLVRRNPLASESTAPKISPTAVNIHKYLAYFESICPSLTPAEEDVILKKYQRSPEILITLALLRSTRRQEFINEALLIKPAPDIALYAALRNVSFAGDKSAIAREMGGAYGNLYVALDLTKNKKSKPEVMKALEAASTAPKGFMPLMQKNRELQEEVFIAAGRDPLNARARALLETKGNSEITLLTAMDRALQDSSILDDRDSRHY
jgi:hypothetical protein